ncbi:MAG: glycosyltransferase [Clostridia bacterium]|nr:glycosyltransferase [Clostridia bacterium]
MIKLVHVITDTNIGGAGILLCNLLRNLDRDKFDICVVLPNGSKLEGPLSDVGVRLIYTENGRDRSNDRRAVSEYRSVFAEEKPDIVHTHGAFSARVAAKKENVPVRIYTRHCAYPVGRLFSLRLVEKAFGRLDASLSHAAVAVAEAAKENLVDMGVKEENITVIINGSEKLRAVGAEERGEIRRSAGAGDGALLLLMCARLETVKGHRVLIDALSELKSECDIKAVFLGDGSEAGALRGYAKEKGVSDLILFAGFHGDVAPYMAAADINVNCSLGTETSSLAISEGFSAGLPAVISDFGGNPAMARYGGAEVLPTGDPKALASALKRLYYDRERLAEMSKQAASAYEEHFTAKEMARQYESLYEKLLSEFRVNT